MKAVRSASITGVAGVVAALALASGAAASAADPNEIPAERLLTEAEEARELPRVTAELDGQVPASNVPDDIGALATEIDRNFEVLSLEWDDTSSTLTVWIDPAADRTAIEDEIRAAGVNGIRVANAQFSEATLQAAAERIVTTGTYAGAEGQWAGPAPDGSGLDIGVSEAPRSARLGTSAPELEGIPVSILVDGEVEPTSRDLDSAPFKAGADISRAGTTPGTIQVCTSAFSITAYHNGSFEDQMLTAAHCGLGSSSTTWRTGYYSNSPIVGTQISGNTTTDIMKLRGQTYGPYTYFGPNDASTAVAVKGSTAPIVNQYVHYSGARSGTGYNSVVTHTNLTVSYPGADTYEGISRTVHPSGLKVVGNGDSGGPVFALNSEGQVFAVGVISGMTSPTNECRGDPASASRQCSDIALYAQLNNYFATNPLDGVLTAP